MKAKLTLRASRNQIPSLRTREEEAPRSTKRRMHAPWPGHGALLFFWGGAGVRLRGQTAGGVVDDRNRVHQRDPFRKKGVEGAQCAALAKRRWRGPVPLARRVGKAVQAVVPDRSRPLIRRQRSLHQRHRRPVHPDAPYRLCRRPAGQYAEPPVTAEPADCGPFRQRIQRQIGAGWSYIWSGTRRVRRSAGHGTSVIGPCPSPVCLHLVSPNDATNLANLQVPTVGKRAGQPLRNAIFLHTITRNHGNSANLAAIDYGLATGGKGGIGDDRS